MKFHDCNHLFPSRDRKGAAAGNYAPESSWFHVLGVFGDVWVEFDAPR